MLGGFSVRVGSSRALYVTRLWHLRLYHISKKGLKLFHRRKIIKGESFDKLDFYQECVYWEIRRMYLLKLDFIDRSVLAYVRTCLCTYRRRFH